jgi:hypothetical protein
MLLHLKAVLKHRKEKKKRRRRRRRIGCFQQ